MKVQVDYIEKKATGLELGLPIGFHLVCIKERGLGVFIGFFLACVHALGIGCSKDVSFLLVKLLKMSFKKKRGRWNKNRIPQE